MSIIDLESTNICGNSQDIANLQEKCRILVNEYCRLEKLLSKDKLMLNDSFENAIASFMKNEPKPFTKDAPARFLQFLEQRVDELRQQCIRSGIQV